MLRPVVAAPNDWLEWIGPCPDDEAEAVAYDVLVRCGIHRYADVAGAIADELLDHDLECYGPTVEARFFRRWYVIEAYRLLHRLQGSRVRRLPYAMEA
jgi:hypothetical protein